MGKLSYFCSAPGGGMKPIAGVSLLLVDSGSSVAYAESVRQGAAENF